MKKIILDIGCGKDKKVKDAIGLDKAMLPAVDIVCDIAMGIPIKENVVDEIYCSHVLEHIRDLEGMMAEFHRILKAGGLLRIWVPHCFSAVAFGDMTHCRYFTYETFLQYDKLHPKSYYHKFHFRFLFSRMQLVRNWYKPNLFERFLEKIINYNQRIGERFLKCLPYKDWEVYTELKKK